MILNVEYKTIQKLQKYTQEGIYTIETGDTTYTLVDDDRDSNNKLKPFNQLKVQIYYNKKHVANIRGLTKAYLYEYPIIQKNSKQLKLSFELKNLEILEIVEETTPITSITVTIKFQMKLPKKPLYQAEEYVKKRLESEGVDKLKLNMDILEIKEERT